MILLASLCYAAGSLLIKHRAAGIPPVAVAASNMAIASLVTLPLALASPPGRGARPGDRGLPAGARRGRDRRRVPLLLHC